MGLYNVEEKEAVKMMADTDKRRMTNYNFYTDQKWGKASNYTLCLNSSQLGYDRCEKLDVYKRQDQNGIGFYDALQRADEITTLGRAVSKITPFVTFIQRDVYKRQHQNSRK